MRSVPEVGEVPDGAGDTFPYWGTRWLGTVQINIGVLVFVLGIVDLILTMTSHDKDLQNYGSRYGTVVTMTVVSSPLWCGLWFSVSGALGACMTHDRAPSLFYSKIAFLVLNVLCFSLFGPACAVINGFISYTRHNLAKGDYQWLTSLIICFLAIIEVVMATVSASITCCCSTLRPTQVHVIVNPRIVRRTQSDFPARYNSHLRSCPSRVNINDFSSISDKQDNQRRNSLFPPDNRKAVPATSQPVQGKWLQVEDVHEQQFSLASVKDINEYPRSQVLSPALVKDVNEYHLTQGPSSQVQDRTPTSGYSALKKWALPSW